VAAKVPTEHDQSEDRRAGDAGVTPTPGDLDRILEHQRRLTAAEEALNCIIEEPGEAAEAERSNKPPTSP
jgi:hypothetical protein